MSRTFVDEFKFFDAFLNLDELGLPRGGIIMAINRFIRSVPGLQCGTTPSQD
jgi:hypothetical protein